VTVLAAFGLGLWSHFDCIFYICVYAYDNIATEISAYVVTLMITFWFVFSFFFTPMNTYFLCCLHLCLRLWSNFTLLSLLYLWLWSHINCIASTCVYVYDDIVTVMFIFVFTIMNTICIFSIFSYLRSHSNCIFSTFIYAYDNMVTVLYTFVFTLTIS